MGLTEEVQTLADLIEHNHDRQEAIDAQYLILREGDQLNRYVLHRFMCAKGCQVATMFRYAGLTLCAVRDYKLSPGKNTAESVAEARRKNTLDGARHWPAHVYDVGELVKFDAGMTMVCRHVSVTVNAGEALSIAETSRPGRPGKPSVLKSH